jgi:hypothetical protein
MRMRRDEQDARPIWRVVDAYPDGRDAFCNLLFHFCYRTHVCAARGREYWARTGFELRYFRRGRPPLMGRQLIDEPIRKFRPNSIDASMKLVS